MCIRDSHQSAQDGDYGIVYVGYAHDGGDHRRRVGLRAGAGTAQGVVPVSYTHLDVYKRQRRWRSRPRS